MKRHSALDHRTLAFWAADCAEHVLRLLDDESLKDGRCRAAIEAARAWGRGEMTVAKAREAAFAAHAAARESIVPAACAVARSTGHAAATAHVAEHARHAAAYAIKAVEAAMTADGSSNANANNERIWQQRQLDKSRPSSH